MSPGKSSQFWREKKSYEEFQGVDDYEFGDDYVRHCKKSYKTQSSRSYTLESCFFSLRHFGHLSLSCIKTRRNTIY